MPTQKERFLFIDGLRGIAALSVMAFHLYESFKSSAPASLLQRIPWLVEAIFSRGYLGVEIFFVISGFVMAHSLRCYPLDWRNFGVFALRRSVRLDPPYWIAILSLLMMGIVGNQLFKGREVEVPGPLGVVANMFYLDNILGVTSIVPIGWTLCLEFQFYLVFFLMLWVTRRQTPEIDASSEGPTFSRSRALWLFVPATVFAFCWPMGLFTENLYQGLWFPQWFMFLLGVFAYWSRGDRTAEKWLLLFLGLNLALAIQYGRSPASSTTLFVGHAEFGEPVPVLLATFLTTTLIYVAGRRARMGEWLSGSSLQHLGKISYSLYLMHIIAGVRLMRLLGRFGFDSAWGSVILLVIGLTGSLVGAHLMYWFVERPCVRFGQKLRERLVSQTPAWR